MKIHIFPTLYMFLGAAMQFLSCYYSPSRGYHLQVNLIKLKLMSFWLSNSWEVSLETLALLQATWKSKKQTNKTPKTTLSNCSSLLCLLLTCLIDLKYLYNISNRLLVWKNLMLYRWQLCPPHRQSGSLW